MKNKMGMVSRLLTIMLVVSMVLGLSAAASLAVDGGHSTLSTWYEDADTWYLAEGFTGGEFDTYILLSNFDPATDAEVRVTYMLTDGTVIQRLHTVAKESRLTIYVDEEPQMSDAQFATKVEVTDGPNIVAERTMYFRYGSREGGHSSIASQWLDNQWYFAEGYNGGEFDTYILLCNPDDTTDASVTLTYMKQDGATKTQNVTVEKQSRKTIHVDEVTEMSQAQYSTKVEVTAGPAEGIVAERAMYFDHQGRIGGHVTIGFCGGTIPDRSYLAEGYTGGEFDTYVLLNNPSTTTDATVNVTFMKDDGTSKTENYTVPKETRHTIHVDEINGFADAAFGTTIETTAGTVFAERAMYFNYYGNSGGHATLATPADTTAGPSTKANWMGATWYLAEGYTGGNFDTWILLSNPDNAVDADVDVTFVKPDGTTTTSSLTVPRQSRRSIHVDDIAGMEDMSFGVWTDTSGAHVVMERAMYFDYPIP